MNKQEYLQRVFEGQISSLTREIQQYEYEIEHLESGLREAKKNLEETKVILEIAKQEMDKINNLW